MTTILIPMFDGSKFRNMNPIYVWLNKCKPSDYVWGTWQIYLTFKNDVDALAFKLKFGL